MTSATTGGLTDTGARVSTGDDTAGHEVEGVRPQAVAYPEDLSQLGQVLQAASQSDLALTPWGGGTQTSLGNALERLDAVVDLSRLDRIVGHNPADLTATVQAGITVSKLQEVLHEHGQFLALDPPLPDRATVGGSLATAVSGPVKWQYGSPRDTVIGMKVAQADGKLTKSGGQVVKNVSGYDISRLHVGGLGTLGIIAEVSLKLTPLPVAQKTILAAFSTTRQCLEAGLGIFQSGIVPLALTAFDGRANGRMEAVDLSVGCLLAVRLGGRPLYLDRQGRECETICKQHGSSTVEALAEEDAGRVWRRLADFGWDGDTTPVIGARILVPPSAVKEVVGFVEKADHTARLEPAIVSHPAHGTVLVGWFAGGESPTADGATGMLRLTREAVHRSGGKMVIERCPPEVKSGFDVWDDVGESISIMRRLKEQYDPKRIVNPGRFVGGI